MSSTVTTITQANSSGSSKLILKCVERGTLSGGVSKSWTNTWGGLVCRANICRCFFTGYVDGYLISDTSLFATTVNSSNGIKYKIPFGSRIDVTNGDDAYYMLYKYVEV